MSKSMVQGKESGSPGVKPNQKERSPIATDIPALRRSLTDAFRLSKENNLPLVSYLLEMAMLEMSDASRGKGADSALRPRSSAESP